jgi:hypothetical protein
MHNLADHPSPGTNLRNMVLRCNYMNVVRAVINISTYWTIHVQREVDQYSLEIRVRKLSRIIINNTWGKILQTGQQSSVQENSCTSSHST